MTDQLPPSQGDDPATLVETALNRGRSPIEGRLAGAGLTRPLLILGLVGGCTLILLTPWRAFHDKAKPSAALAPTRQIVRYEAPAEPRGGRTLADPGPNPPSLTRTPEEPRLAAPDASPEGLTSTPAQDVPAPLSVYHHSLGDNGSGERGERAQSADPDHVPSELETLRRGSAIGRVHARRLGPRNFLILAGEIIPCVLQTAMDSATPGYVSCLISQSVYSDDGAVLLLDKGSKVLGEYRSAMRQGQARLFVLWTRVVTPDGVAVDLASPASDGLGRAGVGGLVDTHFWDRFGGAILLSVVGAAGDELVDRNGVVFSRPADTASHALDQNLGVGPSITRPQGAQVGVFVAEDLDFSDVYALRAR